ncbi:hypothetical protein S83_008647, partial [Arachis hypogaea]
IETFGSKQRGRKKNPSKEKVVSYYYKVRLKRYMEMRGADGGTSDMLCALPAFW